MLRTARNTRTVRSFCPPALGPALGAFTLALMLVPASASCLPLLSEVFYDAVGSDDGKVFVELFGEPGSPLDGFTLEGVNGANGSVTVSLALAGSFPEDGFFVVADDAGGGTTSVPGADLLLNFDFQNGPDSIVLRDGAGVVDAVGYGIFGAGTFFAGEGTPAADPPAGASLARRFADIDSDDNAADWIALAVPDPGTAPLAHVPEPTTAALLASGLALLAHCSRRRAPAR
jgi:hypothetical protein